MARMSDTSAVIRVVYGGGAGGFNGRKLDRRASGAKQIVWLRHAVFKCITKFQLFTLAFCCQHPPFAPDPPNPPNICDDAPPLGRG